MAKSAIFGILAFSSDNHNVLRSTTKHIADLAKIKNVSSIYFVKSHPGEILTAHSIETENRSMGLGVAIKLETEIQPDDLIRRMERRVLGKEKLKRGGQLVLDLLVYEDAQIMTPHLTLPHPDLHRFPEFAIPASEVWGEYHHPVLNKNLYSIAKEFSAINWGEFHSQGKTLLDF